MKKSFIVAGLIAACVANTPASAQQMNADDLKWINQCINDNKGEPGGTPPIVRAYCMCMNEKMGTNETRSITQWEKANPNARRACESEAGWK
jgi:hypothetical protein